MLSFEKWKKLNENLGNSGCLGLGQTKAVANLQSRWDEMGDIPMKSKKPFGDNGMGGLDAKKKPLGDDLGMGGEGDMDQDHIDGEDDNVDDMDGDNMDDENGDDMDDMDSDGEDQDGDGDSDDHLNGDEEGGEDAPLDMDPSLNNKKKPMAPPMNPNMGQPSMMKKRMKKESTKMSKSEREFWASLQDQAGGTSFVKNEDGDFVPVQEDAVFTPEDPNERIQEPKAGEVGYAPTGRLGGNFSEWAKKFK